MADLAPVVVVGAGPAGCAAALALARYGVQALVLERARFPRDKVCGDVVLHEAQRELAALGLDLRGLEGLAHACGGTRYVAGDGAEFSDSFRDAQGRNRGWWMVKRAVLDDWLASQARNAGVDLREGWEVREVLKDANGAAEAVLARSPGGAVERLPASVVVGADGSGSVVARALGARDHPAEHLALAVRAYARSEAALAPRLQVFTTSSTLPGCAWIAPVGANEANVGIGILKRDGERLARTPRRLFDEVRAEVPKFAEQLAGLRIGDWKGWTLPIASERRALAGDRCLLAGDAGAMIDPFTGHGIHYALMAGRIAGEVIADAVASKDFSSLEKYQGLCEKRFLGEARIGYRLQRLHTRFSRPLARACGLHPGLRWGMSALAGHALPRRELLAPRGLLRALFTAGPS